MLAGAGFRNNTLLAHALCQQALPDGIVDFMRAGVCKPFKLYVNLRAAQQPCCRRCKIQRGLSANIVAADGFQFIKEILVRGKHGADHLTARYRNRIKTQFFKAEIFPEECFTLHHVLQSFLRCEICPVIGFPFLGTCYHCEHHLNKRFRKMRLQPSFAESHDIQAQIPFLSVTGCITIGCLCFCPLQRNGNFLVFLIVIDDASQMRQICFFHAMRLLDSDRQQLCKRPEIVKEFSVQIIGAVIFNQRDRFALPEAVDHDRDIIKIYRLCDMIGISL